jgi:uncharacterized membrane protein YfcA
MTNGPIRPAGLASVAFTLLALATPAAAVAEARSPPLFAPGKRLPFLIRDFYVKSESPFREFGQAHYDVTTLDNPQTWEDIGRSDKLGHLCEESDDCGKTLVCREGICRRCRKDTECPADRACRRPFSGFATCEKMRKKVWARFFTEPGEFFATVFIFLSAMLAAAAGLGGGGMFVPLLLLLSRLKAESTVATSQAMIFCGSLVNLSVFVFQRHPEHPTQAKIDYNASILLEPMLVFGVTVGVVCHQMTPLWVLLLLLSITLGIAFWRAFTKGLKQWQEETRVMVEAGIHRAESYREFVLLTNRNAPQVIGIIVLWVMMLVVSFHGIPPCSWLFVGLIVCLGLVLITYTFFISVFIVRESEHEQPRPIVWSSQGSGKDHIYKLKYPFVALIAGFLGGLLGLGGGVIMSPVLLEVGMHSEAVQATTAVFVFVSSSLATIQYAIMQMHVWDYTVWYSLVCVIATVVGQWGISIFIKRNRRYSAITLAIAAVLLFSLVALMFVGILQVMEEGFESFSMERLCGGGGGIITMDVAPVGEKQVDVPLMQGSNTPAPVEKMRPQGVDT